MHEVINLEIRRNDDFVVALVGMGKSRVQF
jgi:hypothetical protein